jgi:hypothetical protein
MRELESPSFIRCCHAPPWIFQVTNDKELVGGADEATEEATERES